MTDAFRLERARRVIRGGDGAFNRGGLPAVSMPCGFSAGGLPIGLQPAGRAWDEATLLPVANACAGRGSLQWPSLPK